MSRLMKALETAGICAMNGFLKAIFTRQKFQGLFINTALGNFAGYVAGSLVTLASTRHALEGRAIKNLFGVLPRKTVVVHVLPRWLEWLLALIVGFLVMEAVRYCFNHRKYAALLSASRLEPRTARGGQPGDQPEAEKRSASSGGATQCAPQNSTSHMH
jgi:hypothetical protein